MQLQHYFQQFEAGFSRNKHFKAYQQAEVLFARNRWHRLNKLLSLMDRNEGEGWRFQLEATGKAGSWELICRSDKLNARWNARLMDCELAWLYRHPRGRELIPAGDAAEVVLRHA